MLWPNIATTECIVEYASVPSTLCQLCWIHRLLFCWGSGQDCITPTRPPIYLNGNLLSLKTSPNGKSSPWSEVVKWLAKFNFDLDWAGQALANTWSNQLDELLKPRRLHDFLDCIYRVDLVSNMYRNVIHLKGDKRQWLMVNSTKIAILETI